jgi:hypothetical protein
MADPRRAAAAGAGPRLPRRIRAIGWGLSVIVWAIASDARPLLAVLSLLSAAALRGVYVVTTRSGPRRYVIWSPWFFAVAALCELAWLIWRSQH